MTSRTAVGTRGFGLARDGKGQRRSAFGTFLVGRFDKSVWPLAGRQAARLFLQIVPTLHEAKRRALHVHAALFVHGFPEDTWAVGGCRIKGTPAQAELLQPPPFLGRLLVGLVGYDHGGCGGDDGRCWSRVGQGLAQRSTLVC